MAKETKVEGTERRIYDSPEYNMRAVSKDNKRFIEGYASLFNHRSKLIMDWDGVYYEEIGSGAFDTVLEADNLDVLATYNHDLNRILARFTKREKDVIQNTLSLSVDEKGLVYRFEVPDTATGNEVYSLVERGDLRESSFVFSVREEGQEWTQTEDGDPLRVISHVSGLYDVSVVHHGAYSDTDVEVAKRHYLNCHKDSCETETTSRDEPENVDEATDVNVSLSLDEMQLKLIELKS